MKCNFLNMRLVFLIYTKIKECCRFFVFDGAKGTLYNGNGYGKTGFGLAVLESA